MIARASSSVVPWPKNAGAEPMPPKLPQPSESRGQVTRRGLRAVAVSSLRTSQSSGKKRLWISLPSTSTGVPCVPITDSADDPLDDDEVADAPDDDALVPLDQELGELVEVLVLAAARVHLEQRQAGAPRAPRGRRRRAAA